MIDSLIGLCVDISKAASSSAPLARRLGIREANET